MTRAYPERPIVGVGVVVWRGDRVLLVRRGNPPKAGSWSLPGGAQELGETVFETARREVREETGLEVEVIGVVEVVDSIHRDDAGRIAYHYTLIDVVAVTESTDLAAADDAMDAVWADADKLELYALWSETARVIAKSREALSRACGRGRSSTVRGKPG
jgi:8-oxo-dGTP diphosphatase